MEWDPNAALKVLAFFLLLLLVYSRGQLRSTRRLLEAYRASPIQMVADPRDFDPEQEMRMRIMVGKYTDVVQVSWTTSHLSQEEIIMEVILQTQQTLSRLGKHIVAQETEKFLKKYPK
jgi:hypothetical protein